MYTIINIDMISTGPCLLSGHDAVEVVVVVLVKARHRPLITHPQVHLDSTGSTDIKHIKT